MRPSPQGTYFPDLSFDDSNRFSTAESVATRQSAATFAPPYAGTGPSDRNLVFQKPAVFEEDKTPTKAWTQESLKIDDFDNERKKFRRRRAILVFLLLAVLAAAAAVGYLFVADDEGGDNENEGQNEDNNDATQAPTVLVTLRPTSSPTVGTNSPTTSAPTTSAPTTSAPTTPAPTTPPPTTPAPTNAPDFCAPFGVTDKDMRAILADSRVFAAAFNGEQLFYSGIRKLVCLPKDAWGDISAAQRDTIISLPVGFKIKGFIEAIHPDAFDPELVKNHRECDLEGNNLRDLPESLFKNFLNLGRLILSRNPFVKLNNNILGEALTLTEIQLNDMPNLVEFPEFIKAAPILSDIQLLRCPSLSIANNGAYEENLEIKNLLLTTRFTPILIDLGIDSLAKALGIDGSVIQEVDFCFPFATDVNTKEILSNRLIEGEIVKLEQGDELVLTNIQGLRCLPENVFEFASSQGVSILQNVISVNWLTSSIELIHPAAFDINLFSKHLIIDFSENELEFLPNGLLNSFPNLQSFRVNNNPFQALSNNFIGENGPIDSLVELSMNGCIELTEFPESMLFTPKLQVLNLENTDSLENANKRAFEKLDPDVIQVVLTKGVSPIEIDLGILELANVLGINPDNIRLA